jgi:hypothetical protein
VFTAIECASNALRLRMPSSNNLETMFVKQLEPYYGSNTGDSEQGSEIKIPASTETSVKLQ